MIVVESFGIMDRTALFKATVKTIRTRNKALGVKEATKDILGSKRHKGEFGTKAKEVVRVQPIYVTQFSLCTIFSMKQILMSKVQ